MRTLVIHAPGYHVRRKGRRSFEDILDTGVGTAYALNDTILKQLFSDGRTGRGWRAVLLCKAGNGSRAEGTLVRLEPATKDGKPWFTRRHVRRHNVYVRDFIFVPYKSEALNANGVAVI